jgi:hypothetical protein
MAQAAGMGNAAKRPPDRTGTLAMTNPFSGFWRIMEMEPWERDDIDMLGPGYIQFNRDGTGEFRFLTVKGEMDCWVGERDGRPIVEFSWSGFEEMG